MGRARRQALCVLKVHPLLIQHHSVLLLLCISFTVAQSENCGFQRQRRDCSYTSPHSHGRTSRSSRHSCQGCTLQRLCSPCHPCRCPGGGFWQPSGSAGSVSRRCGMGRESGRELDGSLRLLSLALHPNSAPLHACFPTTHLCPSARRRRRENMYTPSCM